jgi:hypothetical protein
MMKVQKYRSHLKIESQIELILYSLLFSVFAGITFYYFLENVMIRAANKICNSRYLSKISLNSGTDSLSAQQTSLL